MKGNLAEMVRAEATSVVAKELIADACQAAKGLELEILDVRNLSDIADYFVVVSGRSDRQVQGIGNRVLEAAEKVGLEPISIEGFEKGHWILIDFGELVVHVFYEPVRAHYDLESLWSRSRNTESLGV